MALVGRVLAEGREHDSVLEGKAPDFEGVEEFGDRFVVGLPWRLFPRGVLERG